MNPPLPDHQAPADRYHGFELKDVCWGYREMFARRIEALFEEGFLGPGRPKITEQFFSLMKLADKSCFDYVLKEFLQALNRRTRWLMELPGIFTDVVELGRELALSKFYYGVRFFESLGKGGFGRTPAEVRNLLTHLRRLREIDEDLAVALLRGWETLVDRMSEREIEQYVQTGVTIYRNNKASGLSFLEGTLKTCEQYILSITRECRLCDIDGLLGSLLRALVGYEVEVADLGQLDADDLIDRGSNVICLYRWLYLPARIREFDRRARNRDWYLLSAVCAAGMLAEDSFPRIHGHPDYARLTDLTGDDLARTNVLQVIEVVRVLRRMRQRWPGTRRLIRWALGEERRRAGVISEAEALLYEATVETPEGDDARAIVALAERSANVFESLRLLGEGEARRLTEGRPGLAALPIRPLSFLPDFGFPATVSAPPPGSLIADLKDQARRPAAPDDEDAEDEEGPSLLGPDDESDGEDAGEGQAADGIEVCYLYDEWSHGENDYYRDFCQLYEQSPPAPAPGARRDLPEDITRQAKKVSRAFERFKPDVVRKEKYLSEGEVINADLLLQYLIDRREEPSPRVNFYERPQIQRRDLAVLILLDVSGSTGGELGTAGEAPGGEGKVIDIEKHAALILGQGLASLGDRFSICGFSSNGRENCRYYVYKDFDASWDRDAMAKVLAAFPLNSTRIGPALRHSGYRLEQIEARQRLVILVTDGRPMDVGYDPNTRYAQHDVRMACEENARKCIHTFGISTEENSQADMEIMFPQRRFAILPDIRRLPQLLPRLYLKLTI